MKQIVLAMTLMTLLTSTAALAKNVEVKVCNKEGKKMQFQVKGTNAVVTGDGLSATNLTVDEVMNLPGTELEKESKIAGEKILNADVYSMSSSNGDALILAVMNGQSGAKYLGTVLARIDILGSTKLCK